MSNINPMKNLPFLLIGDFNLIPSTSYPLRDIQGSNSIPNPRNSKKIEKILSSGELIDLFRAKMAILRNLHLWASTDPQANGAGLIWHFATKIMLENGEKN